MTVSITAGDVRGIYSSCPDDLPLTPMVTVASMVVDEALGSSSLSATRLNTIAMYLAAHFALISMFSEPTASGVEISKAQFAFKPGQGLMSTRFGQQAVALDTTGTLASLGTAKPKARFTMITPNSPYPPWLLDSGVIVW